MADDSSAAVAGIEHPCSHCALDVAARATDNADNCADNSCQQSAPEAVLPARPPCYHSGVAEGDSGRADGPWTEVGAMDRGMPPAFGGVLRGYRAAAGLTQ